jgi:hypothetical protein
MKVFQGSAIGQELHAGGSEKLNAALERFSVIIQKARMLEQHVREDIQLHVGSVKWV